MSLSLALLLTPGSPHGPCAFTFGSLEDDFDVPDETPLDHVPDWSNAGGNQPGDIVVRGQELAQERQIENGSAFRKGGPNGPKKRVVEATLVEVEQTQGYIAGLLDDVDNFIGTTYDADTQTVAVDHRNNGITTRVVTVEQEVTSDSRIGAVVSKGKYQATVNGKGVGAAYEIEIEDFDAKPAGLVAKGPTTEAWISSFKFAQVNIGYGRGYGLGYGERD